MHSIVVVFPPLFYLVLFWYFLKFDINILYLVSPKTGRELKQKCLNVHYVTLFISVTKQQMESKIQGNRGPKTAPMQLILQSKTTPKCAKLGPKRSPNRASIGPQSGPKTGLSPAQKWAHTRPEPGPVQARNWALACLTFGPADGPTGKPKAGFYPSSDRAKEGAWRRVFQSLSE